MFFIKTQYGKCTKPSTSTKLGGEKCMYMDRIIKAKQNYDSKINGKQELTKWKLVLLKNCIKWISP